MIGANQLTRSELKIRFICCMAVAGFAFTLLLGRLFYLQVIKGSSYRYQSENNRVRAERLAPPRGMILDRNGEILADTRAAFDALVLPSELPETGREELYEQVSEQVEITPEEIAAVVDARGPARWKPRLLKRRLTREEMARLEARRLELPGFLVSPNPVRNYPFGDILGPTLGYMGGISPDELADEAYSDYEGSDYLGRSGLEKTWESRLRGVPGGAQVEVDVLGRKFRTLARKPATPGNNIVLSVDLRLQKIAEEALGGEVGSVVAVDVRTGEVLAFVSHPSFDPNIIARGMTPEEWNALVSHPRNPLQTRPLQGLYSPGSTFKAVMALAGLDQGAITPSTEVTCDGYLPFAGRDYRCWKKAGHGPMELKEALEQSCDVYFYQLGLEIGINSIHDYAKMLGLGSKTGIDLPGERSGLVPNKAWKRINRQEPWFSGETLSVSIGQGFLLTTPLQLAVMTAAIAHPSMKVMRPHLVSRIEDAEGNVVERVEPEEVGQLPFRESHIAEVRKGMRMVVTGEHGTGKRSEVEGYPVAGKTGTSQVVSLKEDESGLDPEEVAWRHRDHALYIAFAPYDDPRIAVSVVIDHGGHGGSTAAPVAGKVIEAYRDLFSPDAVQLTASERAAK